MIETPKPQQTAEELMKAEYEAELAALEKEKDGELKDYISNLKNELT